MIKKTLLIAIASMGIAIGTTQAELVVQFSTSGTNAAAGSELDMRLGETGSMFIWMATGTDGAAETVTGAALDVVSSNPKVLQAVANIIENPSLRWADVTAGKLEDLTSGSQAFALPPYAGTGLFTNGEFELYSEIQFEATDIGTTNLSFLEGPNGFGDLLGSVVPMFANGATVNVSAVPEPSTLLLCVLGICCGMAMFRRKR